MSRDYKITHKSGEMYHAKVTDSYGNKYDNYFESASKANDWVYYVWSQELLYNALQQCKEIDEKSNRKAIL